MRDRPMISNDDAPREIRWKWNVELTWADRILRREEGYAFNEFDAHGDCCDAVQRCGAPLAALPERPLKYGNSGVVTIRWRFDVVPVMGDEE